MDPSEKARSHNQKVQEKLSSMTTEEKREQETKMFAIEEKLSKAATKRVDPSEKARSHNQKV